MHLVSTLVSTAWRMGLRLRVEGWWPPRDSPLNKGESRGVDLLPVLVPVVQNRRLLLFNLGTWGTEIPLSTVQCCDRCTHLDFFFKKRQFNWCPHANSRARRSPAVTDAAPGGDMVARRAERDCGEVVNVSPRA
eukprot:COSAG02_NODE_2445_length_8843_cov_21.333143_2_plen_134_part_00